MALQRSYARVWWQNRRPGLQLDRPGRRLFFLFAEHLLGIHRNPGQWLLIKFRDADPGKAIAHHPGDIYAKLETNTDQTICRITLAYGEGMRSIELVEGRLLHTVAEYVYILPQSELEIHVDELALIVKQRDVFEDVSMAFETAVG